MNFNCPHCLSEVETKVELQDGQHVICPECGTKFTFCADLSIGVQHFPEEIVPSRTKKRMTAKELLGGVIFLSAIAVFLFAVWKYDLARFRTPKSRMSDLTFCMLLVGSGVLSFIQWKMAPIVWLKIKQWFSAHVWSIMFCLALIFFVQSYLFFRWYNRDGNRYRSLWSEVTDVESSVDDVESKLGELEGKLTNIERVLDDGFYRLEHKGEKKAKNTTWGW